MSGVITSGAHPAELWPGILAFFGNEYNDQDYWRDLVTVVKSSKHREEIVQQSMFGLAGIKNSGASIQFDSMSQAGKMTALHVVYGLGAIIEREAIEDGQYMDLMVRAAKGLKRAMVQTKNTVVANVFNRGFDTNYPMSTDGKAMFATDHTSSSGSQSNKLAIAADLSEAALEDLCIQIGTATDDRGNRIALKAISLHIPVQLGFEATRILKSVQQNDSANNAINALRESGMFSNGIKTNSFFTDPDAYFVRTDCPVGLHLFQRRALELKQDNDFDTENAKAKTTERYSVGLGDWREYYGSEGA